MYLRFILDQSRLSLYIGCVVLFLFQLRSGSLEISLHKEYELRSLNARVKAVESKVDHTYQLYNQLKEVVNEQKNMMNESMQNDVDSIKTSYREPYKETKDVKDEVCHVS
jgi:DNA phosphorothioation-dependent restriction protein DptG